MTRVAVVVAAVAVVVGVAVALTLRDGGSVEIEQRVLRDGELAGFVAPTHVTVIRDVGTFVREQPAAQGETAARRLRRLGFVAAITEHLRSTTKPADRDAVSQVIEFERVDAARKAVADATAGGPGAHVTAFAVPGIPGARGIAQSRDHGRGLGVVFANDRYFYLVGCAFDARGPHPPTRSQLIAAGRRLYHRVV